MAFSLAEDRGLSRSRFNRHSPGFNQHSPGFVCSVLRIADAGMAFLYHINSLILCVCVCVCLCDRAFSMFSHGKIAESSCFFCSVIFLGWWLSFEPNFEAQLALEVPQRAFRPSFSDPSHSRDRWFDLAGSAFDFDRLSAADRCRSFASVRKMTSEARIRREKQKFGRSACKRSV